VDLLVGLEQRLSTPVGHGHGDDCVAVVTVGDHDVLVAGCGSSDELARLVCVNLSCDFGAGEIDVVIVVFCDRRLLLFGNFAFAR
jgi:hypothetical protein